LLPRRGWGSATIHRTRPTASKKWTDTGEVHDDRRTCAHGSGGRGVLAHDGSGYEQAEAEFCRVEIDEVAVALGPPA
jgi:hypothetical protein